MTFSIKMPNTNSLLNQFVSVCGADSQNDVLKQVAQNARDMAKVNAPHLTGNLARSIYCEPSSEGYVVGSPLIYAWAVEYGSGVYGIGPAATGKPIEPTQASALAFQIDGHWVRVRYVLGQHPQPFLMPACEVAIADVDDIKIEGLS